MRRAVKMKRRDKSCVKLYLSFIAIEERHFFIRCSVDCYERKFREKNKELSLRNYLKQVVFVFP